MNLLSPLASSRSTQARGTPVYAVRMAAHVADVQAAQALRFEVFNLELDEGLTQSYDTGLDADPFDAVCDHLIVDDLASGHVVGTYRLQTGLRARDALGYYSAQEFDFAPFEAMRAQTIELGRACIHADHRNFTVLNLLWKGIAGYSQERGARYLLGCSS
ncbi:MAG: GNAT family N-acetyltransferase, partial [Burkholderiaceae bacterium]|nr:GNAT family N-acetyltransferase [Burkholderiaceae bacterium]